jgi:glutamate-1-semialdehyde 2,1-aminomutase
MEISMKTLAIIQARMGSTRFPNKVMRLISNIPIIELLLNRLAKSHQIDHIILATSQDTQNKSLVAHVEGLGYEVYQGSENDVLDRYYQAACLVQPEIVVRITGDCPLIDPQIVDRAITIFKQSNVDYLSNVSPPTYPDGLDVEVFTFEALKQAWQLANQPHEREHVTPYLRESDKFKVLSISHTEDHSDKRWTVDEIEDFEVIKNIFEYFAPRWDFSWLETLELQSNQPELFTANQHLIRNEGASLGQGQKLWKRAKRVIPGGNMLLSKRPEMFLPTKWPAYFSKAKGCHVWDLDGREYVDMSIMGIGTNILGYGHPEVDEAVRKTIEVGNMSTLNCPEEVYLAERLIELHPWADMVKFARTGGEANAIAIRIARAATGKEKVAVCGYHGWHDWYLAANLGNEENLASHLLPGLEPQGVPSSLRDTIYTFNYNRFDELEKIVTNHDIGVIKMEVLRNEEPQDNFLKKVRNLATEKGIILIFDECTSGFRQCFGGLHKIYAVEPDMAMFGKALGNGYAITAIIGRREVMEAAQNTFISSTFWTERIGPTAALKTLEVMEYTKSWEQITETGKLIAEKWQKLSTKYGLKIKISGLPALTCFSFASDRMMEYKTFITQEMLIKGYLAATSVYVCTEHTQDIIDGYFDSLDPLFGIIAECEAGRDITTLLKNPVCHSGFKRLN